MTTNALRGLILGGDALPAGDSVAGTVFLALGWSLLILAIFAPLAVRMYRRAVG